MSRQFFEQVAILSNPNFNATQVNFETIHVAGAAV
jgi:hypothetical protein